jgi:hypothetical protein
MNRTTLSRHCEAVFGVRIAKSNDSQFGMFAILLTLVVSPILLQRTLSTVIAEEPPKSSVIDQPANGPGDKQERQHRTERQTAQFRRNVCVKLAVSLDDGEIEKCTENFSRELAKIMPADTWKNLWKELQSTHGAIQSARHKGSRSFGVTALESLEITLTKFKLELRVDVDANDRITGIWIVDRNGGEIKNSKSDVIQFGARINQIAALKHTLEVKVVDFNGEPVQKCKVSFYRERRSGEPEDVTPDWWGYSEASEQWITNWKCFETLSGIDSAKVTHLTPGWYRAVASSGCPGCSKCSKSNDESSRSIPDRIGLSEPIQIDESHLESSVTVKVQQGGTIRVTSVTTDDGISLPHAKLQFVRIAPELPAIPFQLRKVGNELLYEHIPPGKYRVSATKWAEKPFDQYYETAKGIELEVVTGEARDVQLALKGRPLTDAERNVRWPWIATGRVTGSEGNPIKGVEIWASAGWGTLFPEMIAKTDDEGRYVGRFAASGYQISYKDADPLNLISAQVDAREEGFYEANLNRQGGMHAVLRRPKSDEELPEYVDRNRLFIRGIPREVDFVLKPAVEVIVQVNDRDGKPYQAARINLKGKSLPPACNVLDTTEADASGMYRFRNVPSGFDWWFDVYHDKRNSSQSLPLNFPSTAKRYDVVLQRATEEITDYDRFVLVSATDETAKDVKNQIAADDKYLRPPLPPAVQEQGRDILRKLRGANRYWLVRPKAGVTRYRYEFKLPGRTPQSIEVTNPAEGSLYERRGISYYSAIDYLTANPETVVFRAVEVGAKQIELVYSLKDHVRVSAGNGVSGTWAGYFDRPVKDGTLIIDSKTHTPIEHHSEDLAEYLSDYVEVDEERYVPLRILIKHLQTTFDWKFTIHKPGLWLFDKSTYQVNGVKCDVEVTNVLVE